jgi:hypothetical protein
MLTIFRKVTNNFQTLLEKFQRQFLVIIIIVQKNLIATISN